MDIQNDVLDYLGNSVSEQDFHDEFDGKSLDEIKAILEQWFPGEPNNDTLAENIQKYAK